MRLFVNTNCDSLPAAAHADAVFRPAFRQPSGNPACHGTKKPMNVTKVAESPEALVIRRQILERISTYEPDSETAVYVDLPKKALQFNSLIKHNAYLQEDYAKNLEKECTELLHSALPQDPSREADLGETITRLSLPPMCLFELESLMKRELGELLEITDRIKLGITLSLPRAGELLPDGGQALESILDALSQVEDDSFAVLNSSLQYHLTRGKLVVKLQKRRLFDIAKSLVELDMKEVREYRDVFFDMYNKLLVVYNNLMRNFDQTKSTKATKLSYDTMY